MVTLPRGRHRSYFWACSLYLACRRPRRWRSGLQSWRSGAVLRRIEELEKQRRNTLLAREFMRQLKAASEAAAVKADEQAREDAERERARQEFLDGIRKAQERRCAEPTVDPALADFITGRLEREAKETQQREQAAEEARRRAAIDMAIREREERREAMVAPFRGDPVRASFEPWWPP